MARVSSSLGFREGQIPFDSAVQRASRTILGCENADPGAITNLINFIVQIYDRAAYFKCTCVAHLDTLGNSGIDLDVIGEIPGIGEILSKSAPVNSIDAEHESLPIVNGADRVGECLIVIQKNIVAIDEF